MKKRLFGLGVAGIAVVACVLAAGCDRSQEQRAPQASAEELLDAQRDAAARQVQTIRDALVMFQMRHPDRNITALRQLVEGDGPILDGGDGSLVDPWGNECKYERRGKRFVVISFGPDGREGTADDIRSDKPQER